MLALIGLLTVAASPTFVRMLRDRRVSRAASTVVDYLRTARTLAIGRGQPMLVTWNANGILPATHPGGTGYLSLEEPIVTKNNLADTCSLTAWHTTATQKVTEFDIQNGKYDYTTLTFFDESNGSPQGAEICFSPTGRMYLRTGAAGGVTGAFAQVMGVPSFAVVNNSTGMIRRVYLMPNGVARMQL